MKSYFYRFVLKIFLFILLPSPLYAEPKSSCSHYLTTLNFKNKSYVTLPIESPLTEEEALFLFHNLHEFTQRKFSRRAGYFQFIFFTTEKSFFLPKENRNIYVSEEKELLNLPAIQKIMAWQKKVHELTTAQVAKDSEKSEKIDLYEVALNTGQITQTPHPDGVYVRTLTTLLGPSTEIIDLSRNDSPIFSAARGETLLISGTQRSAHTGILATTHQSPSPEKVEQRLFLKMSYGHKSNLRRDGMQTGVSPMASSRIQPTIEKDGFTFLKEPFRFSEDEADQLHEDIREAFKALHLPVNEFYLDLGTYVSTKNGEIGLHAKTSELIIQYFEKTNNALYKKLKQQATEVISHPAQYFVDGQKCKSAQATLRIGFKEKPLYSNGVGAISRFHTDGLHSRILMTLLGSPTEVYSSRDLTRFTAPLREALVITGSDASKQKATLHRAPDIKTEDRLLLVLSCYQFVIN